jgi:hypothetical protein
MTWEEHDCGEAWNFLPGSDSLVRGYVMLGAKNNRGEYTGTININKLGADKRDDHIDGVTVIFYAPRPTDNENRVVGWYENARVYRNWRRFEAGNEYRDPQPYSFRAKKEDVYLIPEAGRTIKIITAPYARAHGIDGSYPGQACVFFDASNPGYFNSIIEDTRRVRRACVRL